MTQIEFICTNRSSMEFPPLPIKKYVPEWYKSMERHYVDKSLVNDARWFAQTGLHSNRTIKKCLPVLDYMISGYVLRAHTETLITSEKNEADEMFFSWKSAESFIAMHHHQQCPIKIDNLKHMYIKFLNNWIIKTPPGYSCLFYQPHYLMEKRYTLFPAIVDTDRFDATITFPGTVSTLDSFYITPGTPYMAVFPFKRDEWQSSVRMQTEEEQKVPSKLISYLIDRYKTLFYNKKVYK